MYEGRYNDFNGRKPHQPSKRSGAYDMNVEATFYSKAEMNYSSRKNNTKELDRNTHKYRNTFNKYNKF